MKNNVYILQNNYAQILRQIISAHRQVKSAIGLFTLKESRYLQNSFKNSAHFSNLISTLLMSTSPSTNCHYLLRNLINFNYKDNLKLAFGKTWLKYLHAN
jgi:hypothetical protein